MCILYGIYYRWNIQSAQWPLYLEVTWVSHHHTNNRHVSRQHHMMIHSLVPRGIWQNFCRWPFQNDVKIFVMCFCTSDTIIYHANYYSSMRFKPGSACLKELLENDLSWWAEKLRRVRGIRKICLLISAIYIQVAHQYNMILWAI